METDNLRTQSDEEIEVNEDEIDLGSPRLQEACKRQGFELDELCTKTIPEIREKYKNERMNRSAILLAAQHYEERRVAKLKIVLKERNKIIDEMEEELWKAQQKGKTTRYSPKKVTFQTSKAKQQLREMIVEQQREIDSLIVNGRNVKGGPASYQEWVTKQNAEVAYADFVRSAGQIEVIDEAEFRGFRKRKNSQKTLYEKHKNQTQLAVNRGKRVKQRKIYANEIYKFNQKELMRLEKANMMPKHLSFLKRLDGSLWEHRYQWRPRKNPADYRTNHLAEYFDELPKYNSQKREASEADRRDYASEIAKTQTQQWLQNNKAEFEAQMDRYNRQRDEVMTPARIKKTLRKIETSPANTREVEQATLAALEKAHRNYTTTHARTGLEDDSSDDEWEIKYFTRSPMTRPGKRTLSVHLDDIEMQKNDPRSSYANGFISTSGSKFGAKTQQSWNSGLLTTRSRKTDPKTLSAGFAKAKLEEKFERGNSQRATRDTFYNPGADDDDHERNHREDFRRALQGAKIDHDKEVMGMVLEEQHRDLERNYLLRTAIHPKEKRYYDKVFSAEKAAYNSQLNNLMKKQDNIYKDMNRGYVSP